LAGDFSMRGNWKDKDAGYTLFEHYITYSTKPVKVFKNESDADHTLSTVYKIMDRYYYAICSRLGY